MGKIYKQFQRRGRLIILLETNCVIKISEIIDQSIWEYEQGNYKLAEAMLDFAVKLAAKKKKPKYKGTSKNVPTNMELYNRVKAEGRKKFDVVPSAYYSAWVVKEYKRRGGGYKKK